MPISSRRRWWWKWIAVLTINVLLAVIAGIWLLFPDRFFPDRSNHRPDRTCETVRGMIDYTRRQTRDLYERVADLSVPPNPDDFQGWADDLRYYAEQLMMNANPARKLDMWALIHDSQEIVYLFRFAQEHFAPFSDENPPPLWLKRYNDVAAHLQWEFHNLETEILAGCTATTGGGARPDHPAPTSATTTGTTPVPVPNVRIADNLLKPSELASIVGDTGMDEPRSIIQPDIQTDGVDPPDCAALQTPGNTFSYYAPGRTAVAGRLECRRTRPQSLPTDHHLAEP